MASNAGSSLIKPEPHMRISQIFSEPDPLSGGSQSDQFGSGPPPVNIRQIETGFYLIFFITPGALFPSLIPINL
jgi:hypothetical protein